MRIVRSIAALTVAGLFAGTVLASGGDPAASRQALARGQLMAAKGDMRAARVELMNAIKADGSNVAARIAQARVSLDLGDPDTAEEELKRAGELGASPADTSYLSGHVRLMRSDFQSALQLADAQLAGDAHGEYAARVRAAALAGLGNPDAGRAELEGAIARGWGTAEVWTDLARLHLSVGDMANAIAATGQAVRVGPRNVKVLILAAEVDRKRFGLRAAVPWYRRALAIDPNHVEALLGLAATLGDAGANQEMLDLTRRVLSLDQRNARAWYLQSVMAARAGRFALARSLLNRTAGALDAEPAAMLLEATLDLHDGAAEQAIDRLSDLVEMQPANLTARKLLGAAFAQAKDHDGVIQTLRGLAAREDADAYTLTLIGRAFEAKGDRAAAAALLDRAQSPALRPNLPLVTVPLAKAAAESAANPGDARATVPLIAAMMATGDTGAALPRALEMQRRLPGVPAAHVLAGDVLAASGNWRAAADSYQTAANLDFSESVALRFARALVNLGDAAGATRVIDLYLSQNPQSVSLRLMRADIHSSAGRWHSAIADLEVVRARTGNRDASLLNNLAWTSMKAGEGAAALRYGRAAYALMPRNAAVAGSFGWALHLDGADRGKAVATLEKATRLAPLDPALRFQLAQAYAAAGRKADARRSALRALQSDRFGDRAAAQAWLARL